VRRDSSRWKNRQCRSVQSIIGATLKRQLSAPVVNPAFSSTWRIGPLPVAVSSVAIPAGFRIRLQQMSQIPDLML
jgi:hypothetical protein